MNTRGSLTAVELLGSSNVVQDPRIARSLAYAASVLAAGQAGTALPCPVCAGCPEAVTLVDPCVSCALDAEHRAGGHDAAGEATCSQTEFVEQLKALAAEEYEAGEDERRRDLHASVFGDARLVAACRVAR